MHSSILTISLSAHGTKHSGAWEAIKQTKKWEKLPSGVGHAAIFFELIDRRLVPKRVDVRAATDHHSRTLCTACNVFPRAQHQLRPRHRSLASSCTLDAFGVSRPSVDVEALQNQDNKKSVT